jgi:hypothetical protein
MSQHNDELGLSDSRRVLEASQDIGIHKVARDANGKDIANALVERARVPLGCPYNPVRRRTAPSHQMSLSLGIADCSGADGANKASIAALSRSIA